MNEILTIQNLNKSFDGVEPIKNISLELAQQSITLLTGENGAGKTTLFNLITGLEKPSRGMIMFKGENITGLSPLKIAKLGITRLYQQPRLFKNLSVWENLAAAHHHIAKTLFSYIIQSKTVKQEDKVVKQESFDLLTKFGLQDLQNKKAGELSYGQQKLISFCMIAMNGTQLALLDEPFAGLNPKTIDWLSEMIQHMNNEGITFLIIEHNLNKAMIIADNHIEMKDGTIADSNLIEA